MTYGWERKLAVQRMREDPTVSYRAIAKVLDVSDSTVRLWRDEEGIAPRGTRRRRRGHARPAGRVRERRPRPWEDASEPDLEPDDEPDEGLPSYGLASLVEGFIEIRKRGGAKRPTQASSPRKVASANGRGTRTPSDPQAGRDQTRLRAITEELGRRPVGPRAVALLVEAVPHLRGGIATLAQYGEARGCRSADIQAAERTYEARRPTGRTSIGGG